MRHTIKIPSNDELTKELQQLAGTHGTAQVAAALARAAYNLDQGREFRILDDAAAKLWKHQVEKDPFGNLRTPPDLP